jgi:hypothetical protein
MQSAFAKFVLTQQLKDIGVLSDKESIDDHEDFMSVFRNRKLISWVIFLRISHALFF